MYNIFVYSGIVPYLVVINLTLNPYNMNIEYINKYRFYVLDIKDNRIINGFNSQTDCREFIIDLIPVDELSKKEIKKEKLNYKILTN